MKCIKTTRSGLCFILSQAKLTSKSMKAYLDHSVFGRPSTFTFKHGINARSKCHGHWFFVGRRKIPFPSVFVQFVVIQTFERRIRAKNDFRAIFLKKKKSKGSTQLSSTNTHAFYTFALELFEMKKI